MNQEKLAKLQAEVRIGGKVGAIVVSELAGICVPAYVQDLGCKVVERPGREQS